MHAGRITAVGATLAIRRAPGAEVIDLSKLTVLPGLVDAHNHLALTYKDSGPMRFLTDAYYWLTMMHMRTTIILDEDLVEKAKRLTGLSEKTAVVHAGLRALIAQRSAARLAALGGSDRHARAPRRRRATR